MRRTIIRAVYAGAAATWFAALVVYMGLAHSYRNYPRTPDPEIGRTVGYTAKNHVAYITKDQRTILDWVGFVIVGSSGLILIIVFVNEKWPLRPNE